jgi:methyl-accepting chemotaxis protein
MLNLRKINIGSRLGLGFLIMVVLICSLGGFGIWQLEIVTNNANELGTSWMPSVNQLSKVQLAFYEVRRTLLRHALAISPEDKASIAAQHEALIKERIPRLFKDYEPLVYDAEDRRLLVEVMADWQAYLRWDSQVLQASNQGPGFAEKTTTLINDESTKAFVKAVASLGKHIEFNNEGSDRSIKKAQLAHDASIYGMGGLFSLSVLASIALAVAITRSITVPLRKSVEQVERVARGDLSAEVSLDGSDEVSQLLRALKAMTDHLSLVMSEVRQSSENVANGCREIALGNADLSHRTESQASNLEQTAASMEQLTSTVRDNADSAQQANALASSASQAAERGGDAVGQVVRTMQYIVESSKKISEIIGVIDGIAFQTNILALNAAVEAARAGEHGRGFAVVASEVRTLAQRSANAAKDIKHLIGASVEQVENGTRQVNHAGVDMEDIVREVKRVGALINDISSASKEQTSGISQVGEAVRQLDQMTQQNAALVEQSAAAAASLNDQADKLAEVVSQFKLRQQDLSGERTQKNNQTQATPSPTSKVQTVAPHRSTATPSQTRARAPHGPRLRQDSVTASSDIDGWDTF